MNYNKELLNEIIKYFISGIIAFSIDLGILLFCTEVLDIFYYVSVSLGFCSGLIAVYFMNTLWVFKERKIKNRKKEFIIFSIIAIDGLAMNLILIPFFTEIIGVIYWISKVITTGLVLIWNYFARKNILFNKNNEHKLK